MHGDWTTLPPEVLSAITAYTGPIHRVEPAPAGNHADIAATAHTAHGRLFVKAARKTAPDTDGVEVRSLRNEARVLPHVNEFAPPAALDGGSRGMVRPRDRARERPPRRLHTAHPTWRSSPRRSTHSRPPRAPRS